MSRHDEFPKDSEYRERCGCGRILLTVAHAQGHRSQCDQVPEDSLLAREGFPDEYDP